ncbi:MAG: START domain-containing protein [Smithella sp.]|jgi:hypothetical protein
MKHFVIVLLLLLLPYSTIAYAYAEGDWELTNNKNGIMTYKRIQPGSKLLQLRAITVIDARMENFGQVLRDLSAYPLWMDMCKQAELVDKIDENNMTLHLLMDFPVVSNRDLIVKADTLYDLKKARGIITINMVKNSPVPVYKGALRMPEFNGSYVLEYITREKTGVIYTYNADPGGYLPSFAVNLVGKYMLYNTLKNLKDMVKKDKYVQGGQRSKDRVLFEDILSDNARVKGILKARIMEHCRDAEMIDSVVSDQNIVDLLIKGDGQLIQQLFFSWGSRESMEKTVRAILQIHAQKYTSDKKIIEKIANDQRLINSIIDGSKPGQPSAMDIIRTLSRS